jgi:hypothetical protein
MPNAFVHRLEPRLCFAAGPTVTSELLVGSDDQITALVVGFSGPLDPASAQDTANYRFGGSRGSGRNVHKIRLAAASYNPEAASVTLTMNTPFALTRFKRLKVVIAARRPGGVADPGGNLLDGTGTGRPAATRTPGSRSPAGRRCRTRTPTATACGSGVEGARGRPMTSLIGPNRNVHQVLG